MTRPDLQAFIKNSNNDYDDGDFDALVVVDADKAFFERPVNPANVMVYPYGAVSGLIGCDSPLEVTPEEAANSGLVTYTWDGEPWTP